MVHLYLIAHRVRGKAAFDIAEQMECPHCTGRDLNDAHACFDCDSLGYWWIIPTSGHRAFPYATIPLQMLGVIGWGEVKPYNPGVMPPGWPDHFKTLPAQKVDITSL